MEIRRATPADQPEILAVARAALGWETDARFLDLYRWKHETNAFGPSPCWVAVSDGEIAGFRTFMRWEFRRGQDAPLRAVRAVDTATHPDHQGKGVFRALTTGALEELRADGVDFVFNTPNDQSRPGYLKMGWIELGRPPVAAAVRLRSVARVARSRTAAERWSEPCSVGLSAPEAFADDTTARALLALQPTPARRRATNRSPAFLRWRYGLPALAYRLLPLDDADIGRGALVFRLRRRGQAIEATVADRFAARPADERTMLRRILRRTGADYALFASTRRFDFTPSVGLPALSPSVTWREVQPAPAPTIDDFAFEVGDLELF